jgi:NAD(P)-dependent dehydrogenase (short-subunit alcohol dehydrogenase family)
MKTIITGAASGIGRATAIKFAEVAHSKGEKAQLVLADINLEPLNELRDTLLERGVEAVSCELDLAQADSARLLAEAAEHNFGGLDTLISNAGILVQGSLNELSLEDYEKNFAVNTRAAWLLAKACYPMLKESRGSIVATASISAEHPTPPLSMYSASKSALVMIIRQLAHEWGPDGIRCNCVSPGSVNTGMTRQSFSDPEVIKRRATLIPLQRVGEPEDIAKVIAFLASDEAAYVTGVDLNVDGGLTTGLLPTIRLAASVT